MLWQFLMTKMNSPLCLCFQISRHTYLFCLWVLWMPKEGQVSIYSGHSHLLLPLASSPLETWMVGVSECLGCKVNQSLEISELLLHHTRHSLMYQQVPLVLWTRTCSMPAVVNLFSNESQNHVVKLKNKIGTWEA